MRTVRIILPVAVALGILAEGCTDTNVYHQNLEPNLPNKVTISGTVCTDDPAQRQFPVRMMFIVDTSGWKGNKSDPTWKNDQVQRVAAVENVVNRYIVSPNYSFAVIKFAGEVKQLTDGYTKDQAKLREALASLGTTDPCKSGQCRDWMSALSLALSVFTGDVLTTNPGTLSRTRYVFIFVAHGPPNPALNGDVQVEKQRLFEILDQFSDFGHQEGVAEVAFHTVQVDDGSGVCQGTATPKNCNSATPCPPTCGGTEVCQDPVRLCAEDHNKACKSGPDCATLCQLLKVCSTDVTKVCVRKEDCCPTFVCNDPNGAVNDRTAELLQALAFRGTGDFQRFLNESQLNFLTLKFDTTESVFVKKVLLATNANAKPQCGEIMTDSDADGLADREEHCYGEILSGACKILAECDCTLDVWSRDHLSGTDTDPANPDTDVDGLNDRLEMLFATVNLDPLRMDLPQVCYGLDVPYLDRDGDMLNDCEERLLGTDPSLFDTDRDGYPDQVEFFQGSNYLETDHLKDSDMDGVLNGEELDQHLDPGCNDVLARSGKGYRYRVVDEGLRVVPYTSQPFLISGVEITDVSGRSEAGAGTISFYPAGTLRADGTVRSNPTMTWRDPRDGQPGLEVEIAENGTYLLYSGCACVKDCAAGCPPGQWCNPNTGVCAPDPCELVSCAASEKCDRLSTRCMPDCSQIDCGVGQRCDLLLGKCLTDRCLNNTCRGDKTCDPESGICANSPCLGWQCAPGLRLNENLKPGWITVRVEQSQLPQSGFWCDGSLSNTPCTTDADCPANAPCRIRESVVVGLAHKNCVSFKIKTITLVETLETQPGFGAGINNISVYLAQTPLDNPDAYSIFRAALIQIRYLNGKKDPNWAEIPLSDGDFYPIEER